MTLSEELTWRGFVNQTTYKDIAAIDGDPIRFYFGVDPSSDSMQIGNLASAMMVRHFIEHGHKATLLVGGATGMIGDPDGKDTERELKSLDEIEKNKRGIASHYNRVFAGRDFAIVDNYDWFKEINYLQFLRDIGKHFSMTQLLDRDFVRSRIGEGGAGISYAEFSYSLIQGYDFLHLYRSNGVTLQLSGADQWGNSISGINMIRKLENAEAHVWTAPMIINKATGKKFGKTEGGAIWLDENKTSVYQFYQFWLNVDDLGVIDYMKIYTLLDKSEIDRLEQVSQDNPSDREAQKVLAKHVTTLVHGEEKVSIVENAIQVLFGSGDARQMSSDELTLLGHELAVATSGPIIDILVATGIASSNGEARRLLSGNAISINGEKAIENVEVTAPALIKKGKNSFALVI